MKPTKINLAKIVTLGQVREQKKDLDKQDKALTAEIKPLMDDGEVIETGGYKAELVLRNNRVIDWTAVREKIGQKRFNELATMTQEQLQKLLGADEIDEVTVEFKEQRTLMVNPSKG